jgi:outer membrane lipoprotein carrier protein
MTPKALCSACSHPARSNPGRKIPGSHQPHQCRLSGNSACRALALLGLAVALLAGTAVADTPVQEFVRQLESSYKGVQSLRVDFTQSYEWGSRKRMEKGTVTFARGGRMRWEYRDPQEKLFLSNGKQVLLYVPESKQLTRSTVKSAEDIRVPFRLLLSRLDLHKVFDKIEFADNAIEHESEDKVLRALPKHGDDSGIHEVFLEITPDFDIRQLVVVYADRSRMNFTFKETEKNVRTSPGLFEFTPPPGTEIIDQK